MKLWKSQCPTVSVLAYPRRYLLNAPRLAAFRPISNPYKPDAFQCANQRCTIVQQPRFFSPSSFDDTIYALSTAPGRAGIAIVRISGPASSEVTCIQPCQYQYSANDIGRSIMDSVPHTLSPSPAKLLYAISVILSPNCFSTLL